MTDPAARIPGGAEAAARANEMRPRFDAGWDAWDRAVLEGVPPSKILRELSDEGVIELLGSGGEARRYERDLLTIELQNRLLRARRDLSSVTEAVGGANNRIRESVARARRVAEKAKEVAEEAHRLAEESVSADERLVAHLEQARARARGEHDEVGEERPRRFS